jgi:SAM-dependent methyltransferase
MEWADGYLTEIDYTFGYFPELSPSMLALSCLAAGFAPPNASPLRCLELGFGQGISINIHAAAADGEFWGTDFNPAHVAHALSLSKASHSGATLLDDSFGELLLRNDLPDFDIIALHGVWSWISHESREQIVNIIRRKLRVGGIVYLSYNCHPGWTDTIPLRHVMQMYVELAASKNNDLTTPIDEALKFTQKIADSGAGFFRANPRTSQRLSLLAKKNRTYLAHEFLNRHWEIVNFSDVVKLLSNAKVSFAGSADLINYVEQFNLSEQGRRLLTEIKNPILRETIRDLLINQMFRRDIFIKGGRRLSGRERLEALRSQNFILMARPEDIPLKFRGKGVGFSLKAEQVHPILDALAQNNHAPQSLGDLERRPELSGLKLPTLIQIILILTAAGHIRPTQQSNSAARLRSLALNQHLCMMAMSSGNIAVLASPVIGGGVRANRFEQLAIRALKDGDFHPEQEARKACGLLIEQGERMKKSGRLIEGPEEMLAEIRRTMEQFREKRLPTFRALEIVQQT